MAVQPGTRRTRSWKAGARRAGTREARFRLPGTASKSCCQADTVGNAPVRSSAQAAVRTQARAAAPAAARTTRVALVGNPNVGKSTLFNALTGARQHVGNWPGKTVLRASGSWRTPSGHIDLIDLPGTYSLVPHSPDEAVVRDVLVDRSAADHPDLVVVVLDAANLARGLYLLGQVLDAGVPAVAALTMLDVAEGRGLRVRPGTLAERLGVPVIKVRPRASQGLDRLASAVTATLGSTRPGPPPLGEQIETALCRLGEAVDAATGHVDAQVSPRWLALTLLTGEAGTDLPAGVGALLERFAADAARVRAELLDAPDAAADLDIVVAEQRYAWIHEVIAASVRRPDGTRPTVSDRVDRVLTSAWLGIPVFLAIMWATFVATTRLASPLQHWLGQLVDGPVTAVVGWPLTLVHLQDSWVAGLILDGLVAGVGQLLTFAPLMTIMFVLLAVLEDSGYMARAAFVADRFLRLLGLPGRAFLPLIVGFGCNVPAIAGTRILPDPRHRRLTALLVPFVSCSARLTVYLLLANVFFGDQAGTVVFAMYLLSVVLVVLVGLVLRHTVFRRQRLAPLVLDLPPYRLPSVRLVARQAGRQLGDFLRTAGGIIVATVVVVWLLMAIPLGGSGGGSFGHVDVSDSLYGGISRAGAVAFAPAGFDDWHTTGALVTGFVAKEAVVSTFAQTYRTGQPANARQPGDLGTHLRATFEDASGGHPVPAVLAFLVFLLAYTPCMATFAAQRAEIGTRWAMSGMGLQLAVAWVLAVAVFQIGRLFL